MMAEYLGEAELQAVAVTLIPLPEKKAWLGQVTMLMGAAEFEPFSRVYQPGEVARVPGTALGSRREYALYVGRKDVLEVSSYPLKGGGKFDIEFPLPETNGVVRVAMSEQSRNRLPDSRFFFTLYVGTQPPGSFGMLDLDVDTRNERPIDQEEDSFLLAVNEERSRFGVAPVTVIGSPARLREVVVGAPEGPGAYKRYIERYTAEDPAPGISHGTWRSSWCSAYGGKDAAWTCLEHPSVREGLLDPNYRTIVLGAGRQKGETGVDVFSFMVEPPSDGKNVREEAYTTLNAAGRLKRAPELEAALDLIAAKIADGSYSNKAGMKAAANLVKEGELASGSARFGIQYSGPGNTPVFEGYLPSGDMPVVAIGQATGNLGSKDNVSYTVLVIVQAAKGK